VGEEGWTNPPWSERYLLFAEVMATGNPWAQVLCEVSRNYASAGSEGFHNHGGDTGDLPESCDWERPVAIDPGDAFIDAEALDLRLREGLEPLAGFEPIPFERIGLYLDEYRQTMPDKAAYRRAIAERFRDVRSAGGRHDPYTINDRYPDPPYMVGVGN